MDKTELEKILARLALAESVEFPAEYLEPILQKCQEDRED